VTVSGVGKIGAILLYYLRGIISVLGFLSISESTSFIIRELLPIIGSFDSSSAIGPLFLAFSLIVRLEKLNGCELAW